MRDRARHHVLVIARRQKKEAPPEGFGAWGLSFFWRHALVWMVVFCCIIQKKQCCCLAIKRFFLNFF
ncbi:hypothetical protein B0A58_01425, partial [Flavobacterium branchiophilum NBRC 15030 = ATCC 35035]